MVRYHPVFTISISAFCPLFKFLQIPVSTVPSVPSVAASLWCTQNCTSAPRPLSCWHIRLVPYSKIMMARNSLFFIPSVLDKTRVFLKSWFLQLILEVYGQLLKHHHSKGHRHSLTNAFYNNIFKFI